ncbi:hypothetical protein CAPTEDRAFT_220847 [Capitella teleta]|uniref:Solute carrier family 35 member B1 n=1 Tax=Capitella teleta TaxID=283909 RepID=R7THA1_CAPTE|nr:hypothetical protein CAPTEDRAFT_220847 [Capitella teleta]|eukprot:ELT90500.1 hypothetical protein CAPTEDRAFT_220847 [Capitella teleta]
MASGRRTFLLCFAGIFTSYFIYGMLQENITKGEYGAEKEKFKYTLALVFVQCLANAAFAQMDSAPQSMYAIMSFSYLGAMLASNHALQYVTYPTQVLGKSAKPIPVMLLGVLLARKRYPLQKYLFVLMIVLGVALFLFKDKKTAADDDHTFGSGELLLMLSLTLDGVTGGVQDKIRGEHRTQTHRMMLFMNLWSIAYLIAALLYTGEAFTFAVFAGKYPYVLVQMLGFSVASALGQHFIFMTVTNFGPLTCSIFTTTRKFFTILASVLIFQHPMLARQWIGTILVFVGLALDSIYGKERRAVQS